MYEFADGCILCDSCAEGEDIGFLGRHFVGGSLSCDACGEIEDDGFEVEGRGVEE